MCTSRNKLMVSVHMSLSTGHIELTQFSSLPFLSPPPSSPDIFIDSQNEDMSAKGLMKSDYRYV